MLFFTLLKLLTTIITKSWLNARCRWKFFENCLIKYAKTKKSRPPLKFWNMVLFKSRRVNFLYESPTPLEKLGGLTWKGAPLISKFSKPPFTFEILKVQPLFKGGVLAMVCKKVVILSSTLIRYPKVQYIIVTVLMTPRK